MDPVTIATLAEQGVALALQIYNQIRAEQLAKTGTTTMTPIADLLAAADAEFAAIQAAAVDTDPPVVAPAPPVAA